jgi:hypothetical protein
MVNPLTTLEADWVNPLTTQKKVVNRIKDVVNHKKRDRHREGTKIKGFRMKLETIKTVEHFCVEHDFDQQDFAELAFNHFMEHVVNHTRSDVVNKLTSIRDKKMSLNCGHG